MTTPDDGLDVGRRVESVVMDTAHLPSAGDFQAYESILPGAADRILGMLERQAEHRMDMERDAVSSAARSERLGQLLGLAIVLIVFTVAARLISGEHEISGTVLAVCDLGVLASVYWRRGNGPSATVS